MKRRRVRILTGLLGAAAVFGIWLAVRPPSQPVHAGKPAGWWLQEMGSDDAARRAAATNAFRALGPDVVPLLQRAIQGHDPLLYRWWYELRERFPILQKVPAPASAAVWRGAALDAAVLLGTNALPLLPDVAEAAGTWGFDDHIWFLTNFPRAAVQPLANAMTNSGNEYGERALVETLNWVLRAAPLPESEVGLVVTNLIVVLEQDWSEFVDRPAAYSLGHLGARAESAIPVLLRCLDRPGAKSSYPAAWALGSIGRQPDLVIPALVRATDEDRFCTIRAEAARALAAFGSNALPQSDLLRRLARDEDSEVRAGAREALHRLGLE